MQDDVGRVREAVKHAVAIWLRTPSDRRERSDVEARAAMVATREIDVEALHLALQSGEVGGRSYETADWLQQRANDVKEAGNG